MERKIDTDGIAGYMNNKELECLADLASKANLIVEIGCLLGRSTVKMLHNTNGNLVAIDSWSINWNKMSGEDIYKEFLKNTSGFKNCTHYKETEDKSVDRFTDESIDLLFLDFTTQGHQLKETITRWLPKIKYGGIIAGHEFSQNYPEVIKTVKELFGEPDYVTEMIWIKKLI